MQDTKQNAHQKDGKCSHASRQSCQEDAVVGVIFRLLLL